MAAYKLCSAVVQAEFQLDCPDLERTQVWQNRSNYIWEMLRLYTDRQARENLGRFCRLGGQFQVTSQVVV
jgi:hypothetical protein